MFSALTACIITCHDVYNAGASLQAHALREYLQQQGIQAYTIDYKPDYLSRHFLLWGCFSSKYDKPIIRILYNLIKLPGRIIQRLGRRKKQYDQFTAKHLILTPTRYHTNQDLCLSPPKADVYFAGSDQIWNTLFPNGKDPAFYLSFAPQDSVKASYAASFATTAVEEKYQSQIKQWLHNLDYGSVRESSGLAILQSLGITNARQVLDPVFLLPKEHWLKIEEPFIAEHPYILLYDFDNSQSIKEYVISKASEHGWKIYSILPCEYADKEFSDYGPAMFPALVHHARLVVSNSFHATAFSLIYEKNFVVFNRSESINTRMADLLNLIGDEAMQEKRDYSVIRPRLLSALDSSEKFISTVLSAAVERRGK